MTFKSLIKFKTFELRPFYLASLFAYLLIFANSSFANASQTAASFADALNNGDIETLTQLFDTDAFAKKALYPVSDNPQEQKQLVAGFKTHKEEDLLAQWFSTFYSTQVHHARYLRDVDFKGKKRPLIRLDMGDEGLEYIILFIEKQGKSFQVTDFYTASSGKENSLALTQAAQLMIQKNSNFLLRMLGRLQENEEIVNKVTQISNYQKSGEFSKAYDLIKTLPPEVRHARVILDASVQIALNINDEAYMHELGLLNKHFGQEPDTVFMLIDYHFLREDYASVLKSLDRMMEVYGKDGALLNMKAGTSYMLGDLKNTEKFAKEAIKVEPSYEDAHWTLVSTALEAKNHKAVAERLKKISVEFGYEFAKEDFEADELYKDFIKSEAFKGFL